MEKQTLGNLVRSQGSFSGQSQDFQSPGFTTYLTLFAIGLSHRFPTDQIDTIDVNSVENVAKLSAFSAPIAINTWNRYSQGFEQVQNQPQQVRRSA